MNGMWVKSSNFRIKESVCTCYPQFVPKIVPFKPEIVVRPLRTESSLLILMKDPPLVSKVVHWAGSQQQQKQHWADRPSLAQQWTKPTHAPQRGVKAGARSQEPAVPPLGWTRAASPLDRCPGRNVPTHLHTEQDWRGHPSAHLPGGSPTRANTEINTESFFNTCTTENNDGPVPFSVSISVPAHWNGTLPNIEPWVLLYSLFSFMYFPHFQHVVLVFKYFFFVQKLHLLLWFPVKLQIDQGHIRNISVTFGNISFFWSILGDFRKSLDS